MISKTITLSKSIPFTALVTLILIAFGAPLLFNHQLIAGPIVNATLFLSTMILGVRYGAAVAVVPSAIAFSVGVLPIPYMIPFIVLGNMVLVFSFHYFKQMGYWPSVVISSFLKFSFLLLFAFLITETLLYGDVAKQLMLMMGWMQFLTALLGGVIAFAYLKITS